MGRVFSTFTKIKEDNISTIIKKNLVNLEYNNKDQIIKYLNILRHICKEDFYTKIDKDTSAIFKQIRKMTPEMQQMGE
jgi:hypothetical protein